MFAGLLSQASAFNASCVSQAPLAGQTPGGCTPCARQRDLSQRCLVVWMPVFLVLIVCSILWQENAD